MFALDTYQDHITCPECNGSGYKIIDCICGGIGCAICWNYDSNTKVCPTCLGHKFIIDEPCVDHDYDEADYGPDYSFDPDYDLGHFDN